MKNASSVLTTRPRARLFGRRARGCSLILSLPAMIGCGSDLSTVTGNVTLDGKPIACNSALRGTVLFSPIGGGAPASATVDGSGSYTISTGASQGVRPGRYSVAVSVTKIIQPSTPDGVPTGKPITPPRYASAKESGLTAEVQPGSNTFDLLLTSDR